MPNAKTEKRDKAPPENELKSPKMFALSLRKSESAFAFTPGVGIKHPIR
jgi:hypothetical protein